MSSESPLVFSVTEKDFETAVVQKSRTVPVVVDFWAPWCGPCRHLTPVLEKLVQNRAGDVMLAKVNIDEEQGLATQFRVSSVPMVIAYQGGKAVLEFVGLLPDNQLEDFFNRICPTAADKSATQAAALEKTNPQQAEKLFRKVLSESPNQETAILGLARLLLARNEEGEVAEMLERVGAEGENGTEAERLKAVLWLRHQAQTYGDAKSLLERLDIDAKNAQLRYELGCVQAGAGEYAEALATLFKAGELDRKLAAGKVRETMVKVFHVVGVRSEMANDYRDKLSAILY